MLPPGTDDADLLSFLAGLKGDPYSFVLGAFPWGEDPGPLAGRAGPEPWQARVLCAIRDGVATPAAALRTATVSGNGVGKSALVSWLILWAMSTAADTRGIVTANTERQLKTKTWAELGKWYNLFIGKSLFKLTATALISVDPDHELTWRADMIPWSESNTVAFQGLHNEGRRLFMIFDEASGIPEAIWEAGDGCMTDGTAERLWAVFGNPNSPQGRFRECFSRFSHRWVPFNVDSRTVSFTDKSEIAEWVKDYGEDSDFVRVRVRGVFPRTGALEFISADVVDQAARREVFVHLHDPLVLGVDVARFGDDECVIFIRKGRDGRSHAPIRMRLQPGVADTMTFAGVVAETYTRFRADAVFVDGGGIGGGVVDRLRQLHVPVWDVQFGAKPDTFRPEGDAARYANKRAEMWGAMRSWLEGAAIPDLPDLRSQLSAPTYGFNNQGEIQLEKKEDMKRRGVDSPDLADALALTFAYPVIPHRLAGREGADEEPMCQTDYDPFDLSREVRAA